jgi:tetratricopeptide (TPR) repeat protein
MDLIAKLSRAAALLLLLCACFALSARAESDEDLAFRSAFNLFHDGQYSLAETNFTAFLSTFTNSSHRADAVLYLARSRLEQSNYAGAIDLLENSFNTAGESHKLDYVFWIATSRLNAGDYRRAAEEFGNIAQNPNSTKILEASYEQAECCSRMADWMQVIQLLQQTNGSFRLAVAADPKNNFATMGALLLGQAFFAVHRYADGEKVVAGLDPSALVPDFRWQRLYLLCELEMAAGHPADALRDTTNLLEVALGPRHLARSIFLQGDVLSQLGRLTDALQVYAKNLADGVPAEDQRQAIVNTIYLTIALNPPPAAIQALESLAALRPQSPGLDLIRLNLGQLYLKLNFAPPVLSQSTNLIVLAQTNFLAGALTNLNLVLQNPTTPEVAAVASLDRAWCYWLQANISAAKPDFAQAAAHLPFSEDQAVARFKLADAEFYQRDYAGAVSNYNLLLSQYYNMPGVTNGLFDEALYQIVAADLNLGDVPGASAAAQKILTWYPGSFFGDLSLLSIGEDFDRKYNYAMARQIFTDLLQRSPHSTNAPEVEFAIARLYAHERNWPAALRAYGQWETNHPLDARLPEVEFFLAQAYDKADRPADALMRFTNFVARFPGNSLAPWAQNWVADYYYNQEDYPSAERNYELLFQFPGAGDLAYQARLWAGRAALNYAVDDALQHFFDIVNNTNTPPALLAQTYFVLGDTMLQEFQAPPNNRTNFTDALALMSKLTNGAPTNALALEAIGRLGDYYMAWADVKQEPEVYSNAAQMYRALLSFPSANVGVSARSQAEVGLGVIAEKQHQPGQALAHYCKVVYGYDPDNFDPYWIERAGENAARIYEDQQQWDKAARVYSRVLEAVPALRPVLDRKIHADQAQAEAARN